MEGFYLRLTSESATLKILLGLTPVMSASGPQGLCPGFAGPPPEVLICEAGPRICIFN